MTPAEKVRKLALELNGQNLDCSCAAALMQLAEELEPPAADGGAVERMAHGLWTCVSIDAKWAHVTMAPNDWIKLNELAERGAALAHPAPAADGGAVERVRKAIRAAAFTGDGYDVPWRAMAEAALAAHPAPAADGGAVSHDAAFLLDRLAELEIPAPLIREWHGHVEPAIARLRAALAAHPAPAADAEVEAVADRCDLAAIASCTCDVKTDDIQYHSDACRYRVLEESAALLRRLSERCGVYQSQVEAGAKRIEAAEAEVRRLAAK